MDDLMVDMSKKYLEKHPHQDINDEGPIIELALPQLGTHYDFPHNIPNAWLASRPGHSFWLHVLVLIQQRLEKSSNLVEGLTGP
ncbi:hypothetical protein HK096_009887, partial [Nowakowskiella sp. JEL0078]